MDGPRHALPWPRTNLKTGPQPKDFSNVGHSGGCSASRRSRPPTTTGRLVLKWLHGQLELLQGTSRYPTCPKILINRLTGAAAASSRLITVSAYTPHRVMQAEQDSLMRVDQAQLEAVAGRQAGLPGQRRGARLSRSRPSSELGLVFRWPKRVVVQNTVFRSWWARIR